MHPGGGKGGGEPASEKPSRILRQIPAGDSGQNIHVGLQGTGLDGKCPAVRGRGLFGKTVKLVHFPLPDPAHSRAMHSS